MLVTFESGGSIKPYIHFSIDTFPIGTVIIDLGSYIWEFDLFTKIHNFND